LTVTTQATSGQSLNTLTVATHWAKDTCKRLKGPRKTGINTRQRVLLRREIMMQKI